MLVTDHTAEHLNVRKNNSDITQLPQGPPQLWNRLTGRRGRPVREVGKGVAAGGAEMAAGAAGGGENADDAGSGVAAGAARGGVNADGAGDWP